MTKMKRKEIISKLLKENFTFKTLSNLTDKELNLLSNRLLNEQNNDGKVNVSSKNPNSTEIIKKLSNDGVNVDVTEEDAHTTEGYISFIIPNWAVPYLTKTTKKILPEKENLLKGFLSKVQKKYGTSEFLVDNDIDLGVCDSNDIDQDSTECTRLLLKTNDDFEGTGEDVILDKQNIKEWVENVVKKNYRPYASKKDIIEMVKNKLKDVEEQLVEPAPVKTPKIKPDTEPNTTPNKKPNRDPWRKPGKQPDPTPKFKNQKLPVFLTFKELSNIK